MKKRKALYKAFAMEMSVQYRNWSGHVEALHALSIVQEGMEQIFGRDKHFDLNASRNASHGNMKQPTNPSWLFWEDHEVSDSYLYALIGGSNG
jgi:hypothetical protein